MMPLEVWRGKKVEDKKERVLLFYKLSREKGNIYISPLYLDVVGGGEGR